MDAAAEKEFARVRQTVGQLGGTVRDLKKGAIRTVTRAEVAVQSAVGDLETAVLVAGEAADRAKDAALKAEEDTDAALDKIDVAITESQDKLAQLARKVDAVDARFAEATKDLAKDIAEVQETAKVGADLAVQAIAGGKTINELIELLQKPEASWQKKLAAIETLAEMGSEAKAAVPAIVAALKHENEHVRAAAAGALGRIGAQKAVTVLVSIVRETTEGRLRAECVRALGRIGGHAAVRALWGVINDSADWPSFRLLAAEALGRAGDDSYVAFLLFLLQRATEPLTETPMDSSTQSLFGNALSELAPGGAADGSLLLSTLKRALWAHMDQIADDTIYALARIRYVEALPTLQEIASRASGSRRERTLIAVAMIEGDPVHVLRDALRGDDPEMRLHAVNELRKFGREAEAAVPELIGVLEEDDSSDVRWRAVLALREIATPADRIIAALERASFNDPRGSVREEARWAVRKLRAPSGDIG